MRNYMIDFQEQCIRDQERAKAAAAAAAAAAVAQAEHKPSTSTLTSNRLQAGINSLTNGNVSRTGTLYESRSSISSPYGSGSSLNRTSSIRRASLRNSERAKKLNENFFEVLQARDKIQEDVDEHSPNGSTTNGVVPAGNGLTSPPDALVREPSARTAAKKVTSTASIELPLAPPRIPPPLTLPQPTADTLSDVKRRREERRRVLNGIPGAANRSPSATVTSPSFLTIDLKDKINGSGMNGKHHAVTKEPNGKYSEERFLELHGHVKEDNHEKRICCTIL